MAQLQCKTLGDVSPRGKARVYFACHPEDHKGYFREIVGDLLKYSNCAVYYYDEEPEQDDEVNLYIMKVLTTTEDNGEEMEEFVPVDEDLMDKLIQVVQTNFSGDDEDFEDAE